MCWSANIQYRFLLALEMQTVQSPKKKSFSISQDEICYTWLALFKTKFQLLIWQQLILRGFLNYHTTSERTPLSGQRAEPDLWGELESRITTGHKIWDLCRRISGGSLETETSTYCCIWPVCESVKWGRCWRNVWRLSVRAAVDSD